MTDLARYLRFLAAIRFPAEKAIRLRYCDLITGIAAKARLPVHDVALVIDLLTDALSAARGERHVKVAIVEEI